jgi:2'-5' RNA ligase
MPRVFVAVRLPAELAREVGETQEALRRRIIDVKWVEIENLHLTLRFFGELGASQVEQAGRVVREVTAATTAFPLELSGVGAFPDRGRPRVVWVGIGTGAGELVELARRLDGGFERAGLGGEDRPFRAHLTIGRLRGPDRRRGRRGRPAQPPTPPQAIPEIQAALEAASCGPLAMRVAEVAVVESVLRPRGPLYRDLEVHSLAAG